MHGNLVFNALAVNLRYVILITSDTNQRRLEFPSNIKLIKNQKFPVIWLSFIIKCRLHIIYFVRYARSKFREG